MFLLSNIFEERLGFLSSSKISSDVTTYNVDVMLPSEKDVIKNGLYEKNFVIL
jgi:hypothetical protein